MEVFVTGATGVLGRTVVPLLVRSGHRVRGLARSSANIERIRKLGAEPIEGSLFDPITLQRGMVGCDAVLHLATRIPPTNKARSAAAWAENDRIRREGTRLLVDAALASGVSTLIYPSFTLVYPDSGDRWIDAASTPPSGAIAFLRSTVDAEAEVARFAAAGRRGVSLRMGLFYGPESPQSLEMLQLAGWGVAAMPGPKGAYVSSIWIQDAAAAVVAAMERAPSGVYDVVDDEPLTRSAFTAALASALGRKWLWRPPAVMVRLMYGPQLAEVFGRSIRLSNRRFKEATGWEPTVPSAAIGWPRLAGRSALSQAGAAVAS